MNSYLYFGLQVALNMTGECKDQFLKSTDNFLAGIQGQSHPIKSTQVCGFIKLKFCVILGTEKL